MCRDEYVLISFTNGCTYKVPLRVLVYFTKGNSTIDSLLNKGNIHEAIQIYKDNLEISIGLSKTNLSWRTLKPYATLVTTPDSEYFDLKTASIILEG